MAADIMTSGLRLRFYSPPPLTLVPPCRSACSQSQLPTIRRFLSDLLSRGIIKKVVQPRPLFFSRLFLVGKKGGSLRLVIDLHCLNKYLIIPTFKMESVWNIAAGIVAGSWGCTVDLQDAFFGVPIAEASQCYLAFVIDGIVYVFLYMPFGLAVAPWAFSRVIRPLKGFCHRQDLSLHSYLDDFLLWNVSRQGLQQDTAFLLQVFRCLGLPVNFGKSRLVPSQSVEYLGVLFDLDNRTLSLPVSKVLSIRRLCRSCLSRSHMTRRHLESLVGTLNFAARFVPLGILRLRPLVSWVNLRTSPSSRDLPVPLDKSFRDSLRVWLDIDFLGASVPMSLPVPSLQLMTDASFHGWGGVLLPYFASGVWPPSYSHLSINWLELMAVKLSLEHFSDFLQGQSVLLLSDNSTTVSCLVHQGTYRSLDLFSLSREILEFCQSLSISLVPRHLCGELNVLADSHSRKGPVGAEWSLDSTTFQWLSRLAGPFQVDLFATRDNAHLPAFVSPFPDPLAIGVDAFSLDWGSWDSIYLFPPVKVLHRVVPLLARFPGRGVLVAPLYAPSGWFPALLRRSPQPVPLPASVRLSQLSQEGLVFHGDPSVFMLHAWRL